MEDLSDMSWAENITKETEQQQFERQFTTSSPLPSIILAVVLSSYLLYTFNAFLSSLNLFQSKKMEDFPGCGKLGSQQNKECFWDCGEWKATPSQVLPLLPSNVDQSRFMPKESECLSDCPSVQICTESFIDDWVALVFSLPAGTVSIVPFLDQFTFHFSPVSGTQK